MGNVRSKKVEGGQGGKRGHSNMTHWESTEDIKAATRNQRRRRGRIEVDDQLKELQNTPDATTTKRQERVR
jgi:hypothetical protein